jgi:hypothetical protein
MVDELALGRGFSGNFDAPGYAHSIICSMSIDHLLNRRYIPDA